MKMKLCVCKKCAWVINPGAFFDYHFDYFKIVFSAFFHLLTLSSNKQNTRNPLQIAGFVVRPAGFEPVTFRVGGEGSEKKICCTTRLSSEFLHFDYHFDYLRRRIAPKRLRNEGAVKG